MPSNSYYLVPTRAVHSGIFVLLLSLVFGVLNAVIRTSSKQVDTVLDGRLTSIPLIPNPVALKYEEIGYAPEDDSIDWDAIVPPGRGFIRYDEGGEEKYYAATLYHQIHCLNNLEAVFRAYRNGSALHVDAHLMHCFGYLRQLVLCAADTTLEPSETVVNRHGQVRHIVFGTGAMHQCRDWRQVWDYAAENYQTWKDKDYYAVAGHSR
ncbi:hypothetical protein QCA50_020751 [Cerrena zonata]|uniref:Oxidase ustYa n=1 Tax=Cerrena zonata TaxID=2478898 RepID=A0AAW0F9W1_9APHY